MSKWVFHCAKVGHTRDANFPIEAIQVGEKVYNGLVCSECGCPYFELQGTVSAILGPEGIVQSAGSGH